MLVCDKEYTTDIYRMIQHIQDHIQLLDSKCEKMKEIQNNLHKTRAWFNHHNHPR